MRTDAVYGITRKESRRQAARLTFDRVCDTLTARCIGKTKGMDVNKYFTKTTRQYFTAGGAAAVSALMFLSACSREPMATTVARGNEAVKSGDFRTAVKAFRRAAKQNPDSPELLYNLGMAEYGAGMYSRAAKSLQKSGETASDGSYAAWEALAAVRMAQGKNEAAMKAYETAILSAGRTPGILAGMAALELREKKPEAALSLLSEAFGQTMTEPVVLYNMACVFRDGFKDLPAAKAYFLRFQQFCPPSDKEHAEKADKALDAMSDIEPATSRRAAELIKQSESETTPAASLLPAEQAIKEDPWSPDAIWTCANASITANNKERAAKLFSFFQSNFPADPRAARISGGSLSKPVRTDYDTARKALAESRWTEAVSSFKRAVNGAEKSNPQAWIEYSDALRGAGDNRGALNASSRAAELAPKNADALYRLGYFYLILGENSKAKSAWKRYLPVASASSQRDWVANWIREN